MRRLIPGKLVVETVHRARALELLWDLTNDESASMHDGMRALAAIPSVKLDLIEDRGGRWRFWALEYGEAMHCDLHDALERSGPVIATPPAFPDVPLVAGYDETVQELLVNFGRPIEARPGHIVLPYEIDEWPATRALDIFARIMRFVAVDEVRFLALNVGGRLLFELYRTRASCRPLYSVLADPDEGLVLRVEAFLALRGLALSQPWTRVRSVETRPAHVPDLPPRDPDAPYTTGSAIERIEAVQVASGTSEIERLAIAVRDPANMDIRLVEVRRLIYKRIANYESDSVREAFLWALEHEVDELIGTITYVLWKQTALLAELPACRENAFAKGDVRLAKRIKRALGGAR